MYELQMTINELRDQLSLVRPLELNEIYQIPWLLDVIDQMKKGQRIHEAKLRTQPAPRHESRLAAIGENPNRQLLDAEYRARETVFMLATEAFKNIQRVAKWGPPHDEWHWVPTTELMRRRLST